MANQPSTAGHTFALDTRSRLSSVQYVAGNPRGSQHMLCFLGHFRFDNKALQARDAQASNFGSVWVLLFAQACKSDGLAKEWAW